MWWWRPLVSVLVRFFVCQKPTIGVLCRWYRLVLERIDTTVLLTYRIEPHFISLPKNHLPKQKLNEHFFQVKKTLAPRTPSVQSWWSWSPRSSQFPLSWTPATLKQAWFWSTCYWRHVLTIESFSVCQHCARQIGAHHWLKYQPLVETLFWC